MVCEAARSQHLFCQRALDQSIPSQTCLLKSWQDELCVDARELVVQVLSETPLRTFGTGTHGERLCHMEGVLHLAPFTESHACNPV